MTTHDDRHDAFVSGYISTDFQMMLDSAIESSNPGAGIAAEIIPTDWEIITTSHIVYSPGGWYEDIHKERVSHIAVTVHFRVNGALQGTPQRIKFSPGQQFYNLSEVIKTILSSTARTKQGIEVEDEFNLDNISNRRYVLDEPGPDDYRVIKLTEALVATGCSHKKAASTALSIVQEFPTTHKMDLLFEIALNNNEPEENKD